MCFAGARASDQQDVLLFVNILTAQQLSSQRFVDGGLSLKIESINGFDYRKVSRFDASFSRPFFPSYNFV